MRLLFILWLAISATYTHIRKFQSYVFHYFCFVNSALLLTHFNLSRGQLLFEIEVKFGGRTSPLWIIQIHSLVYVVHFVVPTARLFKIAQSVICGSLPMPQPLHKVCISLKEQICFVIGTSHRIVLSFLLGPPSPLITRFNRLRLTQFSLLKFLIEFGQMISHAKKGLSITSRPLYFRIQI